MRTTEFCGVRAVGKSTMMRHLVATYPERFVAARAVTKHQRSAKRAVPNDLHFPHHAKFEAVCRQICNDYPVTPIKLPRSWWIALHEYDARCADTDSRTAIFDQGLVQYARGITIMTRNDAVVRDYLRAVPLPDVAIIFEVSDATCRERNRVRGSIIKRGHMPPMFRSIELMQEVLAERGCSVVVLDAEKLLEDKAADIVQALS